MHMYVNITELFYIFVSAYSCMKQNKYNPLMNSQQNMLYFSSTLRKKHSVKMKQMKDYFRTDQWVGEGK